MTFYNAPNFPDDISYGSKGGPEFSTTIIKLRSGHEQRNVNWAYPLHKYDVSYGVRTEAQMAALRNFFMSMFGQAHTFRFKDWHDYATASSGQAHTATDVLVSAYASSTNQYQLRKLYTAGTSSIMERTITKPVAATVSASINGFEVVTGNITAVNDQTGVFTIGGEPSFSISLISKASAAVITITTGGILWDAGDHIWVKDVSGMTQINNARYTILSHNSNLITIDHDTTGYSTYTGGGKIQETVATAEVPFVTAGCEFDVQCRFDSDVFAPVHEAFNMTNVAISVREIRE